MTKSEQYLEQMKRAGERNRRAYESWSGADVAEAEIYRLERLFWMALWEGSEIEPTLAKFDAEWRKYATENNAKVESAKKIARGPRAGLSVIEHRWVSPELAETKAIHLRNMAKRIQEDGQ